MPVCKDGRAKQIARSASARFQRRMRALRIDSEGRTRGDERLQQLMRIWSRSDVLDGVEYRLELCQDGDCRRFFRLLPIGAPRSADVESIALTEIVARRNLLVRRDILGLARHTKLESGESYFVDAHGIWFLAQEWEGLDECDAGRKRFEDIAWTTRQPPRLPPR